MHLCILSISSITSEVIGGLAIILMYFITESDYYQFELCEIHLIYYNNLFSYYY